MLLHFRQNEVGPLINCSWLWDSSIFTDCLVGIQINVNRQTLSLLQIITRFDNPNLNLATAMAAEITGYMNCINTWITTLVN
jgi:hypothetical protein